MTMQNSSTKGHQNDSFDPIPPKERFGIKSMAVLALLGIVTTFGATYVGLSVMVGAPKTISAEPISQPVQGLSAVEESLEDETTLLQLNEDENDEESSDLGRNLQAARTNLVGDSDNDPNVADLTPAELEECKIDEKDNKLGPYKCFTNNECKGKRSCTTFGWCRFKHLCTVGDKKKACDASIERTDPKCKNDNDCRGFRNCDDSIAPDADGFYQCDGVSNC